MAPRWLSYIVPLTLARYGSPHNRDIRVVLEAGKLKLLVNGSRESGESVRNMWDHAIRHFHLDKITAPKRMLCLGLGGGTVLGMFTSYYPDLKIDTVDIDPVIIDIAKKYFDIGRMGNVRFFASDAKDYMRTRAGRGETYDILLIDLYIGNQIPDFVRDKAFLARIESAVKPGGSLLINYSFSDKYQQQSEIIIGYLKELFRHVGSFHINFNIFIFAAK
jgi:spermidine synthase